MPSYIRSFNARCQECEKAFSIAQRFCTVVNLDIEGFEKDGFEDGSLNRITCPLCNTEFTYEIPMIVFSYEMRFACLVEPCARNSLVKEPPHIILPDGFMFRRVSYLAEAMEKYRIFKSGCDDCVIEYIKLLSFKDEEALPFDEKNIVFENKNADEYEFSQLDYNNRVLNKYKITFKGSDIADSLINFKNSLGGNRWHRIDRIILKEELLCQNIKMCL